MLALAYWTNGPYFGKPSDVCLHRFAPSKAHLANISDAIVNNRNPLLAIKQPYASLYPSSIDA
ncbi:MAG: hypothetical protein ACI9FD_003602 [Gammaproteobacteria bacterium]|jgi:hypothetical protein